MPNKPDDLDRPLWGAKAIGIAAGLIDTHGNVDVRKVFYLLERGLLPASKIGRSWVTTPRRLRQVFDSDSAPEAAAGRSPEQ